jgi:hypothetical protein
MRSMTRVALASLMAIGLAGGVSASARANDIVPTPAPLSYDLVAEFGTKAGCVPLATVTRLMLRDQRELGGRTITLADGMDQAFADQWRHMAHLAPVTVKMVLAHGFAVGRAPSDVLIDTVEFNEQGCAISRTFLKGTVWDTILHGIADVLKNNPGHLI